MNPLADPIRRMLVMSLGGAGDTLLLTPLLRELRLAFPAAALEVLTMQGAPARDVLAGNACIDTAWHHDFVRETAWRSIAFCAKLRRRRFDLSITPMPHHRLEHNLITRLIGARERLGFDYAIRGGARSRLLLTRTVAENPQAHIVENNLRLLPEALGLPLASREHRLELRIEPASDVRADTFLTAAGIQGRTLIGFHPGSGTTKNLILKRWAPERWAALAAQLAADPAVAILLFGGPDELDLRTRIVAASGLTATRLVIPPAGTVSDTAALIRRLAIFVCGDTLLTHVAAAVQTPEVVIMGPTPHTASGPYGVAHRIVRTGITCSPCYGYAPSGIRCTHPSPMACLTGVSPEMVRDAITSLLHEVGRAGTSQR